MQLEHPYADLHGGQWLRGNLHAHTTRSDGRREPQAVIDDYARLGHDFLMISDHDIFTSAKDHAQFDPRELLLIPGNEISQDGVHLLHVNGRSRIEPLADRQAVIDAARADGGFVIVNHPNWHADFNHAPQEKLEAWNGYAGIEIYNGVIGRLEGSQYATDRWDRLLSKGRRVWGFANDDSHRDGEAGMGWNVAYARQRSVSGIVEALAAGRFYASTGVEITAIQVNGGRIRIESPNAQRIIASREHAKRFAVVDEPILEVEVPADALYVRFECWGRGESFAWTQPFFVQR